MSRRGEPGGVARDSDTPRTRPLADPRAGFAAGLGPVPVPPSPVADPDLLRASHARLRELERREPLGGLDLAGLLRDHGVARRRFLQWASATAAFLLLPDAYRPLVARAAEVVNRIPVIWIEGQDCAGNTEALLRSAGPTVDELLFQTVSLEYHETLMAAAGHQAEQRKREAAEKYAGQYILVVEGSIPTGLDGAYCTIGPGATPFVDEVRELAADAALVIAVGACAFYGGVAQAEPDPTGAVGVGDIVKGKPLVNIPACPVNPANLTGVIVHYALTGQAPALDSMLRPRFAFGYRIHDNCERRAHFDSGEFVSEWGDEGARNNFCLYRMGCKGPMTHNNCSIVRYNEATNWPIGSGHGCIGCSEVAFWDRYAQERPLANAGIPAAGFFGLGVEKSVDRFGLGLLSAAGVGIALHAATTAAARRRAVTATAGSAATAPGSSSPDASSPDSSAPDTETRPEGASS